MKNCNCLSSVCLLILFASTTSLAQEGSPSPTPQGGVFFCQLCPTISVSCPSDIEGSKPVEFNANISNPNAKLTYTWEVVGGVIAEGQGTPAIKVNIVKYRTVTATLHVGGLDPACAKTASCSMAIHHPFPPAQKFDSYGVLPMNKEEARLDLFAAALKQQPGAQAYIFGYDGPSPAGEAQKSIDRAKTYLVDKLGIDQARIVTVDGGL